MLDFNKSSDPSSRRFHRPVLLPDPVMAFRLAMEESGFLMDDNIVPDGRLHRMRIAGDKPGSRNGWYTLHLDHPPSGAFGSWKAGFSKTWCALGGERLTAADRLILQQRTAAQERMRQEETDRRHYAARTRAAQLWNNALPASDDHPYLVRKNVHAHGLRTLRFWAKPMRIADGSWRELAIANVLLVPMWDWSGELHNLQAIFPARHEQLGRDKDFLSGGRKAGLFHLLGDVAAHHPLLLAEGYATAATLREVTCHPVLVTFDAGNLLPVAVETRRRFPAVDLVIAADNDTHTPGNPGLTKARAAAKACGGRLAVPFFAQEETSRG